MTRRVVAALAAAAWLLLLAVPAAGAQELKVPASQTDPPQGFQRTAQEVGRTAAARPEIAAEVARFPGATRTVYTKGAGRWQVSWFTANPRKEIAQVIVDDPSGVVLEAYTGYKVAWTMARGYDGAFGRDVNAPWVWLPLLVAFVVPFLRLPLRWLHLDVLVLAAFSVSLAFFNDANVDASVPITFPLLAYLLVRALAVGLRRGGRPRGLPPLLVPVTWLAVATIFLVGFRVGLNVTSSNVIDVGYAGVIGADRLADGDPLYGAFPESNEHGDTYGPLTYLLYVPFEQALPWSGAWDDLPAARAAAITFDLLVLVLAFLVGRRIGGRDLGILAAYAWAAYPFTLYVLMTNANDALVPAFVLLALLVASSAPARGAAAGLAAMTKLAPAALAPLLATYGLEGRPWRERVRRVALFCAAWLAVVVGLLVLTVDDIGVFWDRTLGFQEGRDAPFSIWGLYDLEVPQRIVQAGAVLLALLVAVVPRRRDLAGLAALCAAVLLALQLSATYWFYLYLAWFFPLFMLAVLAPRGTPRAPPEVTGATDDAPARSPEPVPALGSG